MTEFFEIDFGGFANEPPPPDAEELVDLDIDEFYDEFCTELAPSQSPKKE